MQELLKSKSIIVIGIILTLILAGNFNSSFYNLLDKPWFSLPLIGIYVIYALAGLSIWRSYNVFLNLNKQIEKLQFSFYALGATYTLGLLMILINKFVVLYPIGVLLVIICIFNVVYQGFQVNQDIARKLNGALIIMVYLLVLGLYIATNN